MLCALERSGNLFHGIFLSHFFEYFFPVTAWNIFLTSPGSLEPLSGDLRISERNERNASNSLERNNGITAQSCHGRQPSETNGVGEERKKGRDDKLRWRIKRRHHVHIEPWNPMVAGEKSKPGFSQTGSGSCSDSCNVSTFPLRRLPEGILFPHKNWGVMLRRICQFASRATPEEKPHSPRH